MTLSAIALAVAAPVLLLAHSAGPDAGHCGVPGEQTCSQCHSGGPGTGAVMVSGFATGNSYTPGVAQTLTVTVSDPAQIRWGFQLTARAASNAQQQAGTFTPGSDGFTQLSCGEPPFSNGFFAQEMINNNCANSLAQFPLEYVEHTSAGTRPGTPNGASFTFTWTPPSTDVGNITIYVAGNAANNNNSPTGDHIYTANYTLTAATSSAPAISGVANAAGFQQTIAGGAWVAITGTGLSTTTRTWQASDFTNNGTSEPTQLDGVSVTMGTLPAYVSYISPIQINVQAPAISPGSVSIQVTNANGTSQTITAAAAAISPAFFLWSGKYAVATRPDFSYVGPPNLFSTVTTTPAKPGDTVILWGTGFGATTPSIPPGTVTPASSAKLNDPVSVTVGNLPANYIGGALTPGDVALYQIAIQIPSAAPDGDLPVGASIDGVQTPAGAFITVQH